MSRRDTIAALLAEHGDVVVGQGVTVRAGVRENVRRCVCGLALPWPREEANRAHRAHVADVIDRALDQDEPRQDEGGDREALARVLYDDAGHHAADHWGVESGITRGRYESAADAVLAWMRAEGFRRHPEVEPVAERIAQAFERAAREVLASPSTRSGELHPGVVWAGWLRSQAQRVRTEVSDD